MQLTLHLGCTPLVKAWIEHELGNSFQLTRKSHIGKFIIAHLKRPTNLYPPTLYPETVTLYVSPKIINTKGIYLCHDAERDINNFVQEHIYDLFIKSQEQITLLLNTLPQSHKISYKKRIETFCDLYNLTEVLPYETLKKAFYRYRKNNNLQQ